MLVRGTVLRVSDVTRQTKSGGTWRQRTLRVLDEDAAQTLDVSVPEQWVRPLPGEGEVVSLAVEASASVWNGTASVDLRLVGVEDAPAAPARSV